MMEEVKNSLQSKQRNCSQRYISLFFQVYFSFWFSSQNVYEN